MKDEKEKKIMNKKQKGIKEEIENLTSLFFQLKFIELQLKNSFIIQKELAEGKIYEKLNQVIKMREYNFSHFSKVTNMNSILKIEEYCDINYQKILSCLPKISNVIDNVDDYRANINYGIDRMYLEDNLLCDEGELKNTIARTTDNMESLITLNNDKAQLIEEIRDNSQLLLNLITNEKEKLSELLRLVEYYKKTVLDENVTKMASILKDENNALLSSFLCDFDK